jgi:hypothetical protein
LLIVAQFDSSVEAVILQGVFQCGDGTVGTTDIVLG